MKTEAYSGVSQTSKTQIFAKIVNGWEPLTIYEKSFILEIWPGSNYAWSATFYRY